MDTKAWGPPLHRGLMFIAAGYDLNETPREIKDAHYIDFFRSIGNVLPCRFCRESYKQFFDDLNIESYLDRPCGLMRFYYDMRNKISDKLKAQEDRVAIERYRGINTLDDATLCRHFRELAQVFYTKDPPPFQDVVDHYMKYKAKCSPALKTCRTNVVDYPPDFSNGTDTLLYAKRGGARKTITKRRRKTSRRRQKRTTTTRQRRSMQRVQ